MRLIDANLFVKAAKKSSPFLGDIIQILMDKRPTIDPETLPIVQELRKQLEQVTKERDAAIKDLKYYLETNEENGVVYIPKFIIEKIVNNGL